MRNSRTSQRSRAFRMASTSQRFLASRTSFMLTSALTSCQPVRSYDHPPIQAPVLDRLRDMAGADGLAPSQIGDRAGDLEDPIERPGGEAELLEGAVEHGTAGVVDHAPAAEVLRSHGGVDRGRGGGAETLLLEEARGLNPLGDDPSRLSGAGAQLPQADRRDLDVQVDAVEERAGHPAPVALDERGRAEALVAGVSEMAAGAGVHRGQQ